MFKLNGCSEDDARSIADYLRKAGIKVELKPSIDASIDTGEFLQGRFSELKVDIKDKDIIENYERYINALKKVLESKPTPDDFQEKYLKELFPSIEEVRTKLSEMREQAEHKEDSIEAKELADELQETVSEMSEIFAEGEKAKAFAVSALSLNEIEPGEDVGGRLEDPVVAIPVDLDDYGIEHPRAKRVISVFLDKCYEIYVDEFSAIYSDRLDEEFIERYTDEHLKIKSLSLLLTDLIENHSSDKMDLETFEDECVFVADSKNRSLRVIGYYVAEEIAKVLEKNGLIKIKGDAIRWKK